MDQWIYAAVMKDLPQNIPRLFHPKGLGMIILRRGEEVYALSNRCPHMGCPLASGTLEGDLIRCACHDWAFDVRTGELARGIRQVIGSLFPGMERTLAETQTESRSLLRLPKFRLG